jgi:hypothetical protein
MATAIKLVWRLDYGVSFAYLDSRGAALNALSNTVEKFWQVVGDGPTNMGFAARADRDGKFRTFSLEPTNMSGAIEWPSGIDLDRVLQDESFRGVDRIVRELLRICEVKSLSRAGIRVTCVGQFADGRRAAHQRFLGLIDKEFREKSEASIGPIRDIGFTFEGESLDHVSYRAIFGPYDKKNAQQTLVEKKPTPEQYELLDKSDVFLDIDLFETNFSFAEHSLYRWANTKVAKAVEFVAICTGGMARTLEKK